jgi:hypothetical protein
MSNYRQITSPLRDQVNQLLNLDLFAKIMKHLMYIFFYIWLTFSGIKVKYL